MLREGTGCLLGAIPYGVERLHRGALNAMPSVSRVSSHISSECHLSPGGGLSAVLFIKDIREADKITQINAELDDVKEVLQRSIDQVTHSLQLAPRFKFVFD